MRGELKIEATQKPDGSVRLSLIGSLDAHTMPQMTGAFRRLTEARTLWIVLDLTKMVYISSIGLNFIITSRVGQRKLGGDLLVAGPQPQVIKILKMLGLDDFLLIFPNVKAAWQDIKERRERISSSSTEGDATPNPSPSP